MFHTGVSAGWPLPLLAEARMDSGSYFSLIFVSAVGYFNGPWIENRFISFFQPRILDAASLAWNFGAYIPIFVPWTDVYVKSGEYLRKQVVIMVKLEIAP